MKLAITRNAAGKQYLLAFGQNSRQNCHTGESLHCALFLDYVPPEEPLGTPLGNTLRIRRPKLDWRGP